LPFGGSDGGGDGTNLTASITLPFSKQNAQISGRLVDVSGEAVDSASVVITQRLPVSFEADGTLGDVLDLRVDTVTTTEPGAFSFENVEASTEAYLLYGASGRALGRDPATGVFRTPAASNGSAALDRGTRSISPPPFEATLMQPKRGTDLDSGTPTFTFHFSLPVAETPFTNTSRPFGDGAIRDFVRLTDTGAKRLRSSGDHELSLSFNADRTELQVTPADPLPDGRTYTLDMAAFDQDAFESPYGQAVANAGAFSGSEAVDVSVGINQSTPATPSLSFATASGNQPPENGPPLDYGDDISVDLEADHSGSPVEIKSYELYVKSGDGAFQPESVLSEEDFTFFGGDTVEFILSFQNQGDDPLNNFVGPNGGYNEKQVKVRAVSINNRRSDFSAPLTIADQNRLNLLQAEVTDADNDGEQELLATFNEPVEPSSISASAFTVLRDGAPLSGVIDEAARRTFEGSGQEVVLEVASSYTPNEGFADDELRADDGAATDLAGNDVDTDGGANVVNIP